MSATDIAVSPSGTTIPSAAELVDANGNVWTVSGGVIDQNGAAAAFSADVTLLLYYGGVIYQQNSFGGWWSWNGTDWVGASDPRTAAPTPVASSSASPNGTSIPAAAQIIDASGNVWTVSGGVIDLNGAPAAFSADVTLLLYYNGVIYQQNAFGGWWSWASSAWQSSADPRDHVTLVNGVCGTANGVAQTVAPTTNLCSVGAASAVSGSGGWIWSCAGQNGGSTASCSATSAAPAPSPPPATAATRSANGATIPSLTQLVDSGANVWRVSGGVIYENNTLAAFSADVTLLLYYNNVIYQQNAFGGWWLWNAGSWVSAADPRIVVSATNGTCGTANSLAVKTAPTTHLCAVGSASITSGSGPWSWSCAGDHGGAQASCTAPLAIPLAGENLSGDTSRPNVSTFVLGESVQLTFAVSGATGSQSSLLTLNVTDDSGNAVTSIPTTLSTNGNGGASVTVTAPASKLGYYRVDAAMADGTTLSTLGTRPAGFLTYAVVPDPATRIDYGDGGSRFGLQGGFGAGQGSVIPYLGVRYILSSAGGWAALEPDHAGQFAAARSAAAGAGQAYPAQNAVVNRVTYNGAPWNTYSVPEITTAKLPSWAFDPATAGTICTQFSALNPAGVAGLPGFAQALAAEVSADYPNQSTHYYQVTWEPGEGWCFGGTSGQLVQMYQLVYSALHQADPKAVVTGPTVFPEDGAQLAGLWSAGLGNYLDAQSMHPYVAWPPETNGLALNVRSQMQMAQTAVGRSIPFVGTEHGLTSGSIGELNEALGDIRTTLILLGEGFKFDFGFYVADFWNNAPTETDNTYGFYWNLDPKIDYGTDKMGPKPVAPAFAAMTYLLDGTTSSGPIANLSGTQMGYRFERNGTTILALWDYQAASSTLNLAVPNETVQVCDWMGNCSTISGVVGIPLSLRASPTYVVGRGL